MALFNSAGDRLSTFPFTIWVEEDPSSASGISNNYYYLSSWEAVNSAIGNLSELQTYDQSSLVAAINEVLSIAGTGGGGPGGGTDLRLDTTLTRPGYAADAKAVGDALKNLPSPEVDLTGYAKLEDLPNKPADVGADPVGTAVSTVSSHNTSDVSHNDLRLLISELTTRLNALANSTDEDLDQMTELVAYIKSNKALIDAITTSKVSVDAIVDNLVTNVSNRPLSAAQGVALKGLIDTLMTVKLDANKLPEAVEYALAQAKESGKFNGKDGTSVTVKSVSESTADGGSNVVTLSDGTTLTIKNGTKGNVGATGAAGKTPVRGTDYWTDADKAEIRSYVDDAILGGAW